MGLGATAPVRDAVDPTNRVGPEAFHRADIRVGIQRADVIFRLIGGQFDGIRVGSDGWREEGGDKNDKDKNRRRFDLQHVHFLRSSNCSIVDRKSENSRCLFNKLILFTFQLARTRFWVLEGLARKELRL
ncbi:chitinase A [Striga asiatica]|uniref:Chitinase A n=1 Tax=Striga asiatica TaxID=4170 RepID=A0A5A7PHK6_STRAF|nr:chitinase A [Striga asiatica]